MALTTKQKIFFFAGLNITLYGLALIIMGSWLLDKTISGPSGASMWCGIVFIMCGVGDVIISIDSDYCSDKEHEATTGRSFSMISMIANMVVVIMGVIIIGTAVWGTQDQLELGITYGAQGTEATIEIFVTVILLGIFGMLLAILALVYDCGCCGELFGEPSQQELSVNNGGLFPTPQFFPQAY